MAFIPWSDLRDASRGLARNPTVAISAIVCLALGIGATSAISSAIQRGLLDRLPFREPQRLVAIHRVTPQSGPQGAWPQSPANYLDLSLRLRQIESVSAVQQGTALVMTGNDAIQARQLYVTGGFFPMLGMRPQVGRLIEPADDRLDAPIVSVLSDEFWRARFGGDPSIVGKQITIDGAPTTVVGIAPPDFRVPHGSQLLSADVWFPARLTTQQLASRYNNFLQVVGRLADGATLESAERELANVIGAIVSENPRLRGDGVRVAPLQAENRQAIRTPLLLLFGAVCMVLLIAATNVAALLLARGVQRQREMAVRSALGASRIDTMRLGLLESLGIAAIGGGLGLLLAFAGVRTIGALAAARLPQLAGLHIDLSIIVFAIALSLIVAALCGAIPAWRSATVDPSSALGSARQFGTRKQHRALSTLVVVEIGLSVVLLIGAGLVMKAFTNLLRNEPGFETDHVLTMRVTTSPLRYPNHTSVREFLEPALTAIRGVPGVEAAAAITLIPYDNWGNNSNIRYEGKPGTDPARQPIVEFRAVSPSFFDVTGQRALAGRLLGAADNELAGEPVVVVNQALVDRDFNGRVPIGKRFHTSDTTFARIIGVVPNIRNNGPVRDPQPEMYWSYRQNGLGASTFPLMIRVRGTDPVSVASAVRSAIRGVDPTAAIASVAPMKQVIARSLGRPRFYFSMLGTFAAVAIVLTVAGLYGVLSYTVAQRRKELGIRIALGSSTQAILRLVTVQGLRLVGLGLAIGLAGGWAATRLMVFMLYGVSPLDASTWGLAALFMVVAGGIAVLIPAVRATRVDPLVAIQTD